MIIDNKAKKGLARQGDVVMEKWTAGIPKDARKMVPKHGRIVFALGEVTGHQHSTKFNPDTMEAWETDEYMFLTSKAPFEVTHDEHDTIPSDAIGHVAGEIFTARVYIQKEYQAGEIKKVLD